mgnify:FL=1
MEMKSAFIITTGIIVGSFTLGVFGNSDTDSLRSPNKIVSGKLLQVKIWTKQPGLDSSNSASTYNEGHVDIYSQFIIITGTKGRKTVCPHSRYTGLVFEEWK